MNAPGFVGTYRAARDRAAKQDIQTNLLRTHAERIAAFVSGLAQPDALQVGALGLLIALERVPTETADADFWGAAEPYVRSELAAATLAALPPIRLPPRQRPARTPLHEHQGEREAFERALATNAFRELLTPDERAAAVAVFIERRSTYAAATHLGWGRPALLVRLARARAGLRGWLAREVRAS